MRHTYEKGDETQAGKIDNYYLSSTIIYRQILSS